MPTLRRGALESRRSSIAFLEGAWFALIAAANALAQHPFAPPVVNASYSINGCAGVLDVNRDGAVDLVLPGLFFGSYTTTLDEQGAALWANGAGPGLSPVPGDPHWPTPIAMATGRLDQDHRDDLITITTCGSLHFHRNLGSTRIDRAAFAPDTIIDVFAAAYPANPPFVCYSFPAVTVVDFDGDGHRDAVVAGGPTDYWAGVTMPGFAAVYRGDSAGNFQVVRAPLPGNVVDAEVADLDLDGVVDHLVVLSETGGGLVPFTQQLIHLAMSNGSLVVVATQWVGPGRCTALEVADVIGDANLDYIVGQTMVSAMTLSSAVTCFAGDGLGHADLSNWGSFVLPSNLTGISDYLSAIQVADFDRDGHADLAALRSFVQPQSPTLLTAPLTGPSEVLIAMGPNALLAPADRVPLSGTHQWSWAHNTLFGLLPLRAQPDMLRVIDLGGDHAADLLVTGVRQLLPSGSLAVQIAALRNTTPPQLGSPALCKVGQPSGADPLHPARIGFDGGTARIGNAAFACTISNVQGGALVGLMWGSFALADLATVLGFQLHLGPGEYGYAAIASGSQAGEGFHSYPLPIPLHPSLIGDVGWFQYCYYDPALGRFGGTQATGVWIAP